MRLLTIVEAAELLRLSPVTVRIMRCEGRLPGALRIGGRALFDASALEAHVRAKAREFAASKGQAISLSDD